MRLDEVVDELVAAVPAAAQEVMDFRLTWDRENPPMTILMGTLGEVYVHEAERLSEPAKRRFFAIVEQALREGDDRVQNAVATGLLEAAVSTVERADADRSEVIDRYAGPLTRQYLQAWDDFCFRDGGGSG
jgi:hypothetical protein